MKDKKNIVIALLTILCLIRIPQAGFRFIFWILSGIVLCSGLDILINRIRWKKSILPKSAIITGFIVSGILDYHQPFYMLAIIATLAVLSKHIIQYKDKHILNPANFALFTASVFKLPLTWSIESNIYLIILVGLYLAYSIKKIFQVIGFLVFFSVFSLINRINPFIFISWFFLFIMLIEPKTSGFGMKRGFVFGGISGITAFPIYKFVPVIDIFTGSLFVANLANPVLQKIRG
ncbi:MAG: hypothetical protein CO036_04980 [Candidatus Omnitrophica bacterium CG_4_9_14_0_2_um_filter_43_12]|nr:MAG: hypothetical protein CO036_04980 [Candidatus Omnitrophica bacterium CG_4_9_14_0_2_um_filter_43_12]